MSQPGKDAGRFAASETLDLSTATPDFFTQYSKALFVLHNKIFTGTDEQAFVRMVFQTGAAQTKIRIFKNALGEKVGYAAIHRYPVTVAGRLLTIFRAEAGLLPGYRGRGVTFYFYAFELLKYRLRHGFEPIFYLGMLVHPSSYLVFARYFHEVYPKVDRPTPDEIQALMVRMAEAFGVEPVSEADPLVRRVGWITRQAKPFWDQTKDRDVEFYRRRNPGYRLGHGLVVLVPMTVANLLHSLILFTAAQLGLLLKLRRNSNG